MTSRRDPSIPWTDGIELWKSREEKKRRRRRRNGFNEGHFKWIKSRGTRGAREGKMLATVRLFSHCPPVTRRPSPSPSLLSRVEKLSLNSPGKSTGRAFSADTKERERERKRERGWRFAVNVGNCDAWLKRRMEEDGDRGSRKSEI